MQLRKWTGALISAFSGILRMANSSAPLASQTATPVVYLAAIDGVIDLGIAPFVQGVTNEATSEGAGTVILEINTLGNPINGNRMVVLHQPIRRKT
jgi:membrane-bound ClpP family serine protease